MADEESVAELANAVDEKLNADFSDKGITELSKAEVAAKSKTASAYDSLFSGSKTEPFNIVKSYDWCINHNNLANDIPVVYAQEYRQNLSTFAASLNWTFGRENSNNSFNANIGKTDVLAPYKSMYSYGPVEATYVFPYLSDHSFELKNSFGDKAQTGGSLLENLFERRMAMGGGVNAGGLSANLSNLKDLVSGLDSSETPSEGIYIERPKFFQYDASADSVSISFTLYNTISVDKWQAHKKFLEQFILKNLPWKETMFKYKTPALYEVLVPREKYFPVAYVSSFSVKNRGTSRRLSFEGKPTLVPEAWDVTITFTSLLLKSANLYQAGLDLADKINISVK